MGYRISIDTGGTFTDGVFAGQDEPLLVKVDSTPHDFTVCFAECIQKGAEQLGLTTTDLLKQTEEVRFSSTVGTNKLITRSGNRVGLIVTRGHEQSLYGQPGEKQRLFEFLLSSNTVVGIDEEVDATGTVIKAPRVEDIRAAAKRLLEHGSRSIVVSLAHSSMNPANERFVKDVIQKDYPRHYLGAVPVLLSVEVTPSRDDALRTNTAVMNAYLHRDMARFLYRAEEMLWSMGYRRPLLVVHGKGGMTRVATVVAIQTLNSGPAGGAVATAYLSRLYGLSKAVGVDIGGTSLDATIVVDGTYDVDYCSEVAGVPIAIPLIDLQTVGGGGGSIAKVNSDTGELQVGPDSAGAIPGPACYDLGNTKPTAADACVVLGYIDPHYFLGGSRTLNAKKAREAIENEVARPLGISVEDAALRIVEGIERIGAQAIKESVASRNIAACDLALFAFGGAGGLFCPGIAAQLDISQVYSSRLSPGLSAFGVGTLDISHYYERSTNVTLWSPSAGYLSDFSKLNSAVAALQDVARRDIRGEGFPVDDIVFSVELDLKSPSGSTIVKSPAAQLDAEEQVKSICNAFGNPAGEIVVELVRLTAVSPITPYQLPTYSSTTESPDQAYKGERTVYWKDGPVRTVVYEQRLLQAGNVVGGPSVIESEYSIVLVPPGSTYTVDRFLNGVLVRDRLSAEGHETVGVREAAEAR